MWERDKESWIGILPRHGSVDQLRWFKRPTAYSFHVGNAYNEGSMVYIDLCLSQRNAFPGIPDADGAPYNPEEAAPFLTRWSFDAQDPEQSFSSRQLSPIPGELPRVDGRVVAAKHRVIYYGGINPELPLNISGPIGPGSNLLVRVDVESGAVSALHLRDADSFQEPQLVPAADHEGYLLVVVIITTGCSPRWRSLRLPTRKKGLSPRSSCPSDCVTLSMVVGLQVVRRTEPEPPARRSPLSATTQGTGRALDPFRAVASFSFVHQLSIVL